MKKIINLAILLLSIKGLAQPGVVVPKDTNVHDIQSGTYIKDIDNEFLPYVGTWKGVLNGKEYTFVFQVFPHHLFTNSSGFYHYEDVLKAKYEVKDIITGSILISTLSALNYEDFLINSLATPNNGILSCNFIDTPNNCYNTITFSLTNVLGAPNQIRYGGFTYTDFYIAEGCPYMDRNNIPVPIPNNGLIFTKQ
jgi:hypothetical protein